MRPSLPVAGSQEMGKVQSEYSPVRWDLSPRWGPFVPASSEFLGLRYSRADRPLPLPVERSTGPGDRPRPVQHYPATSSHRSRTSRRRWECPGSGTRTVGQDGCPATIDSEHLSFWRIYSHLSLSTTVRAGRERKGVSWQIGGGERPSA